MRTNSSIEVYLFVHQMYHDARGSCGVSGSSNSSSSSSNSSSNSNTRKKMRRNRNGGFRLLCSRHFSMCFAYISKNVKCCRVENVDIWNPRLRTNSVVTKGSVLVSSRKTESNSR